MPPAWGDFQKEALSVLAHRRNPRGQREAANVVPARPAPSPRLLASRLPGRQTSTAREPVGNRLRRAVHCPRPLLPHSDVKPPRSARRRSHATRRVNTRRTHSAPHARTEGRSQAGATRGEGDSFVALSTKLRTKREWGRGEEDAPVSGGGTGERRIAPATRARGSVHGSSVDTAARDPPTRGGGGALWNPCGLAVGTQERAFPTRAASELMTLRAAERGHQLRRPAATRRQRRHGGWLQYAPTDRNDGARDIERGLCPLTRASSLRRRG